MHAFYAFLVTVLAVTAGAVWYFYYVFAWEGVVAGIGFLLRNVIRRALVWLGKDLIWPFIPPRMRMRLKRIRNWFTDRWRQLTRIEQVVVTVSLLVLVGFGATYYHELIATLSVLIPKTWMSEILAPFVVRWFAAIGIDRFVPEIWQQMPKRVQERTKHGYGIYWRYTKPRMVRGRRAFGTWIKWKEFKQKYAAIFRWLRKPPT